MNRLTDFERKVGGYLYRRVISQKYDWLYAYNAIYNQNILTSKCEANARLKFHMIYLYTSQALQK